MNDIVERFEGQITNKTSRVRVEPYQGHLLVWLLTWGNMGDDHGKVPVALIKQSSDVYKVAWFRGDDDQPSGEVEYRDRDKLFAAIDGAIRARDADAAE